MFAYYRIAERFQVSLEKWSLLRKKNDEKTKKGKTSKLFKNE